MSEEEDYGQYPHIIIDNGTGYCKAGFSNEEGPRTVIPSCVGYPKYSDVIYNYSDKKEFYVGEEANRKRGILKLNYPMENGVINNWDDMEKIWGYIFTNELRAAPEEHNVMLTEAPFNPKENREKMAQIMFETFNVPNFFIYIQAILSLYSAGKYTGFVLDSGDGVTHSVPVFEGYCLPHAIIRHDVAGRDLTEYMIKLLYETGFRCYSTAEKEIAKKIKEECIYIPLDFQKESVEPYIYELPDGNYVTLTDQRIRCPEALFRPSYIGKEGPGIHEICHYSIQKCDIDLRKELYYNIILSGGTTMIKGLSERLTEDLKIILGGALSEVRVKPSENKFAIWQGGAIASNLEPFKSQWITKEEYEESGATIVHRKCF